MATLPSSLRGCLSLATVALLGCGGSSTPDAGADVVPTLEAGTDAVADVVRAPDAAPDAGCTGVTADDPAPADFSPTPTHVHLNWSDSPATTVAVVWATDFATTGGAVQYGTTACALGQTATATSVTNDAFGPEGLHEAHLAGLAPDTTYYYRVGTPGNLSAVHHFKTAPATTAGGTSGDVNFVVFGDSRDGLTTVWPQLHAQIRTTLAMNPPDFAVFTGDAVFFGPTQLRRDEWFDGARAALANMPWLLAQGNHESLAANYLLQFAQPTSPDADRNRLYFSLDYGPIHFVVLNDTPAGGNYASVMGAETTWLTQDLTAVDRARTPWVIAVHHKAPYSSSSHHGDSDVQTIRALWPPVYDRFHVDLVLNGHDHDLEVSHPLVAGAPVTGQGTVYITSGGAGASGYPASTTATTQYSETVNNFLSVHATRTTLDVAPYRLDGTAVSQARVHLTR